MLTGMPEPAGGLPPRRIELTINEARLRFLQLVRLTGLTRQITEIMDQGRPIAAIVPANEAAGAQPGEQNVTGVSAAGWMRRLETMRDDLKRQHDAHAAELTRALGEAWQVLDDLRPPGSDRHIDALRAAHADLRRGG